MTEQGKPYPPRYFRLRYAPGFSDELVAAVRKGYDEWVAWVEATLSGWEDVPHRAKLPKPTYFFSQPELSHDRTMITVRVDGDPITHGAMMIFEDGVPTALYYHFPREFRDRLEIGYENSDYENLNRPALIWRSATS